MSVDTAAVLERLAEYGRNGKFILLEEIHQTLPDIDNGEKSCKIPIETCKHVLRQFMRLLRNSNNSERRMYVWSILSFMCDRENNTSAWGLLTEVDSADILRYAKGSIAGLLVRMEREANACLSFIVSYGKSSKSRQVILGRTEGLIETVLQLINTGFHILMDLERSVLLKALFSIIHLSDIASCEIFIQKGGFRIMNKVLAFVYQTKSIRTTLSTDEEKLLTDCLGGTLVMFSACFEIKSITPDNSALVLSYDPAGLIRTTSTLHDMLGMSKDPTFVVITIAVVCYYLAFVEKVHPESLEFVLLYRGRKLSPTTYSGVPMIIHVVLISRDPQFQHYTDTAQDLMHRYTNKFPSVDKMLTDTLSTIPAVVPASGPVPIVCALPSCIASSLGGNNRLKQCSRCRAVYYCCLDHQTEHWTEHKLTCVPKK